MSRDQTIGGVILAVCVIIAVGYAILVIAPGLYIGAFGLKMTDNDARLIAAVVPVAIGVIAILAIGAWIGYTMATTPPPKPIEEITAETEAATESQSREQEANPP